MTKNPKKKLKYFERKLSDVQKRIKQNTVRGVDADKLTTYVPLELMRQEIAARKSLLKLRKKLRKEKSKEFIKLLVKGIEQLNTWLARHKG